MEHLPKVVRERLQARQKAGVHPDPDLLAAYAENALSKRERLSVLDHLSCCADCREVVFLAQPEMAVEQVASAAAVAASPVAPRKSSAWIFAWAAVAACLVIGGVLLRYEMVRKQGVELAAREAAPAMKSAGDSRRAEPPASAQPAAPAFGDQTTARLTLPPPEAVKKLPRNGLRTDEYRAGQASGRQTDELTPVHPMVRHSGTSVAAQVQADGGSALPGQPLPQSSEQGTVTTEADATSSVSAPKDLPLQARSIDSASGKESAAAAPPTAVQSVKPPAAAGVSAPGTVRSVTTGAFATQMQNARNMPASARPPVALAPVSAKYIPGRWTISTDGSTLLRSTDGGKSWNVVNVAKNVVFRAVAATGPEIWAGGEAGALYHSSDAGVHWIPVKPSANGTALTSDVVSVDFSDLQHGKVISADGKVWATADGGNTWQTQ